MRNLSLILIVYTLNFCTFVFADDKTYSLANELKDYVREIESSIHTYHYVSRENLKVNSTGLLNLEDPILDNHVEDWGKYFWNLNQKGGTGMIRGFYLASDPVVSRTFGNADWLLYRVKLKPGLKYLDGDQLQKDSYHIPKNIVIELEKRGCSETKWHYLIYKNFDSECRKIALQTLRDLDVELIGYSWMSADYPPFTRRPDLAFILIQPEKIEKDQINIFYKEMNDSDPKSKLEQRMLESFFLRAKPNAADSGATSSTNEPEKYKLWPQFDMDAATDEEFTVYLKRHILGCKNGPENPIGNRSSATKKMH